MGFKFQSYWVLGLKYYVIGRKGKDARKTIINLVAYQRKKEQLFNLN